MTSAANGFTCLVLITAFNLPFVSFLSAAPREPVNLQATVDGESSVVTLTWEMLDVTGGRSDVTYWIECSLCPVDVAYSPSQRDIQNTEAVVSNLDPHTTYQFKVHSRSGISDQSGEDYFSTVNATTLSPGMLFVVLFYKSSQCNCP